MALAQGIRLFNLVIAGQGQAGAVTDIQLPEVKETIEEFKGGYMSSVGIPVGLEKMELEFTLHYSSADTLSLFGLEAGKTATFVFTPALENEKGVVGLKATIQGRIIGVQTDPISSESIFKQKFTVQVSSYVLEQEGTELYNIDIERWIYKVRGQDRLAAVRTKAGIS
ncbi:phage major tail tube protein [Piscirickettsia litoralis]|uniref:Phage major tail tube protein n=1 Tax=Piscirickettsia litoralis TaxID=1891921 RepID=A0ABX2ZXF3_9GAMM|nr:phage major tail tube protein [Piscirickettsia litoralis]ODN41158.1 hypothetical protein BGC07_17955 [Piscirickettsia litoralis]